jgi:hypothetical protein
MKRFVVFGAILAACFCLSTTANAQWSDDFDAYVAGSQIVGQGGWEEWGTGAGALVSSAQSMSSPNSVEIMTATDLIHQYSGYTSGQWKYSAMQYIPGSYSGLSYFIMLNTYAFPSGPYVWSVQVGFDSVTGLIQGDCGSSNQVTDTQYLTDQWVPIECYIDLTNDWVKVYYDGQILDDPLLADHPTLGPGYEWSKGPFGSSSGVLDIGALDLFANGASEIYYDDIVLEAAPPLLDARINGDDAGVVVPAGSNVTMDVSVMAGKAAGFPVDIWVALATSFGVFTYDGNGPYGGWNFGIGSVYKSGPLADTAEIVLNRTLPAGSYKAHLGVDTVANGVLGTIVAKDTVDFIVQ